MSVLGAPAVGLGRPYFAVECEQLVRVTFTEYALGRMVRRDILPEEVMQALDQPPGSHGRGRTPDRREVRMRIGPKTLLVVYQRSGDDYLVINAMWE